jgi:hypothetical protein
MPVPASKVTPAFQRTSLASPVSYCLSVVSVIIHCYTCRDYLCLFSCILYFKSLLIYSFLCSSNLIQPASFRKNSISAACIFFLSRCVVTQLSHLYRTAAVAVTLHNFNFVPFRVLFFNVLLIVPHTARRAWSLSFISTSHLQLVLHPKYFKWLTWCKIW